MCFICLSLYIRTSDITLSVDNIVFVLRILYIFIVIIHEILSVSKVQENLTYSKKKKLSNYASPQCNGGGILFPHRQLIFI